MLNKSERNRLRYVSSPLKKGLEKLKWEELDNIPYEERYEDVILTKSEHCIGNFNITGRKSVCRGCGKVIPAKVVKYSIRVNHQYGSRTLWTQWSYCIKCSKELIKQEIKECRKYKREIMKRYNKIKQKDKLEATKEMNKLNKELDFMEAI